MIRPAIPAVKEVRVGNVTLGGRRPLVLIAGPCVIESEAACLETAGVLKELTQSLRIPLSLNPLTTRPTGAPFAPTGDRG